MNVSKIGLTKGEKMDFIKKYVKLKEFVWQENLEKLKSGGFGDIENPNECFATLARYWKAQAEAGYPYAVENMTYFDCLLRKMKGERDGI